MAVTSDAFIKTDLDARIPELWPDMIQDELFPAVVAANFFTDMSGYAKAAGGDIMHVLDAYTNSFSGQTQSTQGTEVTTEGPALADVTLTINTHAYVATLLGDFHQQLLMKSFDAAAVYTRKMALGLTDGIEDAIFR
jgi:hypothetical protein